MRISDWSSDVCSSDLFVLLHLGAGGDAEAPARALVQELGLQGHYLFAGFQAGIEDLYRLMDVFVLSSRHEALGTSVLEDRKSVVSGKSVSVRVDLGGRRIIKKKKQKYPTSK